jgi:hypothetical protein
MSERTIGIQLGPQTVFDEGPERVLDNVELAGVNALFVYSHTYYGAHNRRPEAFAGDHGVPVKDERERRLTRCWVTPHEEYYGGTFLRHVKDPADEYGDRDVFETLAEPAAARGVKLYARILEPIKGNIAAQIPNWSKILARDVFGNVTNIPSFDHTDYVNFLASTVEDLFRSYPLAGFMLGCERVGPLSRLLFRGEPPADFSPTGLAAAVAAGIDIARAREGWLALYRLVKQIEGGAIPTDGAFVSILRTLFRYPEIIAWDRREYEAMQVFIRSVGSTVKAVAPEAEFGVHMDHQQVAYDFIFRAHHDYTRMADYVDFIKPSVYHDVAGPRIRGWFLDNARKRLFRDTSDATLLDFFYDILLYDREEVPELEELTERGFTPEYVAREIGRLRENIGERAKIYAGVAIDVPLVGLGTGADAGVRFASTPEGTYTATKAAFEGGADGLVISREYDEMRLDNLRAAGRAVAEVV